MISGYPAHLCDSLNSPAPSPELRTIFSPNPSIFLAQLSRTDDHATTVFFPIPFSIFLLHGTIPVFFICSGTCFIRCFPGSSTVWAYTLVGLPSWGWLGEGRVLVITLPSHPRVFPACHAGSNSIQRTSPPSIAGLFAFSECFKLETYMKAGQTESGTCRSMSHSQS